MGYLLDLARKAAEIKAEPDAELAMIAQWLDQIEERDPAIREHVLRQCRADAGSLAYFLRHARGDFLH